jgi:hypothetical protein
LCLGQACARQQQQYKNVREPGPHDSFALCASRFLTRLTDCIHLSITLSTNRQRATEKTRRSSTQFARAYRRAAIEALTANIQ